MRTRQVVASLVLLCALGPALQAWGICDCDGRPFAASHSVIIGREATLLQNVLVNDDRGRLKVGRGAFMPDTTNLTGSIVQVGAEASVGSVNATLIRFHPTSSVAGPVTGPLAVPVVTPFCSLPALACGLDPVTITVDQGIATLGPGVYGNVKIGRSAFVRLLPGHYQVCDFKVAHSGAVVADGAVTMDIVGNLRAASAAIILPGVDQPRPHFNVEGSKVLFGNGSVVRAEVAAPSARLKIGQLSAFEGCFCSRDAKVGNTAGVNCTAASPSGAFLD